MYFSKIKVHNFGIYKGTHEMPLTDKVGERNVTLVGGLNGRGKTTFHDAVLLAMYGKQALNYIQENARSYDRYLLDHINKQANLPEAFVEVTLVLEDGSKLVVRRSWRSKGTRVIQSMSVKKNSAEDEYLAENWQYYVEEILPFGIAKFFFFNNEKITQLADDATFEQVKGSIKSAIGVLSIERAIAHINEVIRRKEDAVKTFENDGEIQEYQEAERQIAEVGQQLDEARHLVRELDQRSGEISAMIQATEKQFWESGGELSRNRDAILQEKQRLSAETEQIRANMLQLTANPSTPLLLCRDLVSQSYDDAAMRHNEEAMVFTQQYLGDIRTRIINKLQNMGFAADTLRMIESVIEEELHPNEANHPGPGTWNVSASNLLLMERLIADEFTAIRDEIVRLSEYWKSSESRLMNLDNHLGAVDDKTLAMRLYDTLKELEHEKNTVTSQLEGQTDRVEALDRQWNALKAKKYKLLADITGKKNEHDDNARILRYAAMSIRAMEEFKLRLQREKVATLSDTVTQCFKDLVEKDSLVQRIEIDPDTLDVVIIGNNQQELYKSQLSAGEQQMFAISFVWALALTSGYQSPVMIDTPMARLDSLHRENFVTKYLPVASSQVIVLSTDEEVYGRYLDLVRDYVVDEYTLLYQDSEQCTSIVHGYFEVK